jgi:hypothetical protein
VASSSFYWRLFKMPVKMVLRDSRRNVATSRKHPAFSGELEESSDATEQQGVFFGSVVKEKLNKM